MNALKLLDQLALAAWELAEAETLERSAAGKRKHAARLMAAAHAEVKAALAEAHGIKARQFPERIEQNQPTREGAPA